jgi:uncharacterized protein (TIGR03437 family)
VPSPSPSPTPTPSPVPGAPIGLARGELTIVRSTAALAPSNAVGCPIPSGTCASETKRSPSLPVELNGVSVGVNGVAAGLYFVGNDAKQINFVIPITVPLGVRTVAVANTNTLLRGLVNIIPAQPDIFTTTDDEGGRAAAFTADTGTPEPFNAGSNIQLHVTGVRGAARGNITVTVGTTVITGEAVILAVQPNLQMLGFDIINFTLPASLAGAGDVPIQVTFNTTGFSAVSRPAATAPHITIN